MPYQDYPAVMNHPAFAPAVLADDGKARLGIGEQHARGTPVRFPPVQVKNADQEAEYAAKGYVRAGGANPQAFADAQAPRPAPGKGGPREYPKMLQPGDVVVRDEAEELAALQRIEADAEAARLALLLPSPLAIETGADTALRRLNVFEAMLHQLALKIEALTRRVDVAEERAAPAQRKRARDTKAAAGDPA